MRFSARSFLIAALLTAAVPAVAHAQIYAWRDANGNWVLSGRPKDPGDQSPMTTYAVTNTSTFRTTSPVTSPASQYDTLIEENAAAHGVSPHLVRAVIQQESAFNPWAVSNKGAMGLMQLMPETAAELGVLHPYDPSENIRGGVKYLKGLLTKFSENVELALAAYNAGPTAVTRYGSVPPYKETQKYVTRIKSAVESAPKPKRIYKTIEIVDGREVPRYSTVETPGSELVTTAKR